MQKVLRAFVFLLDILPSFCLFLSLKTLKTSHCSARIGASWSSPTRKLALPWDNQNVLSDRQVSF